MDPPESKRVKLSLKIRRDKQNTTSVSDQKEMQSDVKRIECVLNDSTVFRAQVEPLSLVHSSQNSNQSADQKCLNFTTLISEVDNDEPSIRPIEKMSSRWTDDDVERIRSINWNDWPVFPSFIKPAQKTEHELSRANLLEPLDEELLTIGNENHSITIKWRPFPTLLQKQLCKDCKDLKINHASKIKFRSRTKDQREIEPVSRNSGSILVAVDGANTSSVVPTIDTVLRIKNDPNHIEAKSKMKMSNLSSLSQSKKISSASLTSVSNPKEIELYCRTITVQPPVVSAHIFSGPVPCNSASMEMSIPELNQLHDIPGSNSSVSISVAPAQTSFHHAQSPVTGSIVTSIELWNQNARPCGSNSVPRRAENAPRSMTGIRPLFKNMSNSLAGSKLAFAKSAEMAMTSTAPKATVTVAPTTEKMIHTDCLSMAPTKITAGQTILQTTVSKNTNVTTNRPKTSIPRQTSINKEGFFQKLLDQPSCNASISANFTGSKFSGEVQRKCYSSIDGGILSGQYGAVQAGLSRAHLSKNQDGTRVTGAVPEIPDLIRCPLCSVIFNSG